MLKWVVVLLLALAGAGLAQEATVRVDRFSITGNTILDQATIDAVVRPHQGKDLTLREIKGVARALRAVYRQRGYVLAYAYVPPQEFANGTVELRVQQGDYGQIKVEGNRHYSEAFIRRFFRPALATAQVYQPTLQRALLTLNQFLDLRVQSALESRKNGVVDVTLKVKDERPVHALFDYDNYGVRLVGRNRVGAGVLAGNVITDGDQLVVKLVHPFEIDNASPFQFATYSVPVGDEGTKIEGSFAKAKTSVGAELANLGIQGDAHIYNLRLIVPHELDLQRNHVWTGEFISKNVVNTALSGQIQISQDDVRAFAAGHRGTHYAKDGKTQIAHAGLLTVGTGDAFGGSPKGSTTTSRAGAGADNAYVKGTVDLVGIRRLRSKLFAVARLSGQLADDALVVPEQFTLGGPDSVRGFEVGEFLGDNGYSLSAELRQTVYQRTLSQVQAVAFFDHGHADIERPGAGERASRSLSGAGVGMRGQLGKTVSVRADVGFPLDPSRNTEGDDAKLHAQISSRF